MRRPADVFLLYAARAARGFGDGFAIIILPAYLSELGFGPFQIGIVASAALLGTAAVTLAIGFLAPGRDLRNLLLVGAFATVATGLAFQATEQFATHSRRRLRRNNEPFKRRYRTICPARTCHTRTRGAGSRSHPHFCTLQPDRWAF